MSDRVKHRTELVQLDRRGLHWLHTCHDCSWQHLICEHEGDGNPVRDAEAHPLEEPRRTRLVVVTDAPEDRASETESPPED